MCKAQDLPYDKFNSATDIVIAMSIYPFLPLNPVNYCIITL